ncbi:hypothetical protein FRC00_003760 [Tulasnella sp. 408]|nr:hypothetical protein FRC00_003760 [Tulasnella sp. 408]
MLGSTLLSAATALFFLPAVFSAPVALATSVSVSEVDTTITTTKSFAMSKAVSVLEEKTEELQMLYKGFLNVDTSTIDSAFLKGVCEHTAEIVAAATTAVQAASTVTEDSVAVNVNVKSLVTAIANLVAIVLLIVGHVLELVVLVKVEVGAIVGIVLHAVLALLSVVLELVPGILALVAQVLFQVTGIVEILKAIVAADLDGATQIVAILKAPM